MYPDHPGHQSRDMDSTPRSSRRSHSSTDVRSEYTAPIHELPHRRELSSEHPSGSFSIPEGEQRHTEGLGHAEGLDRVLSAGDRPSSFFDGEDAPTMTLPTRSESLRRERAAAVEASPSPAEPTDRPTPSARPSRSRRRRFWSSRKFRRSVTLAVMIGLTMLVVPVIDGTINGAEGVVSGSFQLSPGQAKTADSGKSFLDGTGSADFVVPTMPTGGGVYLEVETRASGHDRAYLAKTRVFPDGSMRLGMVKIVNGEQIDLGSIPVPGQVQPEAVVHVQTGVAGDEHPELTARTWVGNDTMPPWQYSITDPLPPSVVGKGTVRVRTYLSRTAGPLQISFQDLSAQSLDQAEDLSASPSEEPTASANPTTSTANPSESTSSATSSDSSASSGTQPSSLPGASNTGVPAGTKLTQHKGDLTITKAGTTIDALDIHGFVIVKAANVTIKRSIVRGGKATWNRGLITNTTSGATGLVIEDCDLIPATPTLWLDGVKGGNFTVRRVNIDGGVVDGVKVHGNNVVVEDSWIHDLTHYSQDPNHSDGSHNDGVQVLGGTNIAIKHNTITVGTTLNAVMQVTQDYAPTKNLSFTQNWVDGGTCSVKLQHRSESSLGPVTVSMNSFGSHTEIDNCAILRTSKTSLRHSGNVWTSTGSSVSPIVYG